MPPLRRCWMQDLGVLEKKYRNHFRATVCGEAFTYILKLENLARAVEHHFNKHHGLETNLDMFGELEEDDVSTAIKIKKHSTAMIINALKQIKRHMTREQVRYKEKKELEKNRHLFTEEI